MIYADYNATTSIGAGAREWMKKAEDCWGNPSSTHGVGRQAKKLLESARDVVAEKVGAHSDEIVFTSGGSEANASVLMGTYFLHLAETRILTSKVEHSSILGSADLLKKSGAKVEFAQLKASGELDLESLGSVIERFRPQLVSLMSANNETGILFPIPEVAALCAANGALLHTDAVQALGKIAPTHWEKADFVSVSAHKIHGPKGVGALRVKKGRQLAATHFGGSQETKRRGGTQNIVGVAGFAGACEALPGLDSVAELETLRNRFEAKLKDQLTGIHVQGEGVPRLPNTTNVRIEGIRSEVLLSALDLDGVCLSAGSACSSGSVTPSHVLTALGLTTDQAREALRISWGFDTTAEDVDTVAQLVVDHVGRIRERRKAASDQ